MKKVTILGSTGSIGTSALKVIERHRDRFRVVGLAVGKNLELLRKQIETFQPKIVSVATQEAAELLQKTYSSTGLQICYGSQGLIEVATHPEAELVISALVGALGLLPTYRAIQAGKDIALANKETLVMAGGLIMQEVAKQKSSLLPIDSEHSALFQCLLHCKREEVRRVILTASGGPFLDLPMERFVQITVKEALQHPNWKMGRKITVDSATLMNKGLEVIEAYWLFGFPIDKIDIAIHPQSVVHCLVELKDGSLLAHMGIPDMQIPIQYALSFPERLDSPVTSLPLSEMEPLEFRPPDKERFPCLGLAYRALREGGTMPMVLSAANEVTVASFLAGEIQFLTIPSVIEETMQQHRKSPLSSIEQALEVNQWAMERAKALINKKYKKG
ncbi:MAG: 1-deoxy-D-xylulose-5-phosphate reductoisomerase [Candidatus Aminicenantes bacterium]|nr:1-deoxy-D-xylulose-5-phosphate reductoisomerase [Candidatus Aminicenantes bacterium]MDH5715277.1 1-deoxy-D-xylulose-5-phosphate reductoisomerase [Candidatus Aminicenantes bacterium]